MAWLACSIPVRAPELLPNLDSSTRVLQNIFLPEARALRFAPLLI